jgi:hypothetical protein
MQKESSRTNNTGSIRDIYDYLGCFLLFIFINVFLFHTGLYDHIALVDSFAGNVHGRISILSKLEETQAQKPIVFLGDSTTEDGLGAKELSQLIGKPVANLGLPGTAPKDWVYFLRSIDPERDRFETIVIMIAPHNMRSRPHENGVNTLLPVAPLKEMLSYSWQFHEPSNKIQYIYSTFDKVFAFRQDLRNLFLSPGRIFTIQEEKREQLDALSNWQGKMFNVCDVQRDPSTGRVRHWGQLKDPEIRELAKNAMNRTAELNRRPQVSGILEPLSQIMEEYRGSGTRIVVVTIPFGIEHRIRVNSKSIREYYSHIQKWNDFSNVWHWNAISESLFRDCRNFYDFRHMNERGRKKLTERLAAELTQLDSQ